MRITRNIVKINNNNQLEWYVGASKMDVLIKFLNEIGHKMKEPPKESHRYGINIDKEFVAKHGE